MRSRFERRLEGVIRELQKIAWMGTPRQYAACNQSANALATAMGVRNAAKPKKDDKKSRRKPKPKPKPQD